MKHLAPLFSTFRSRRLVIAFVVLTFSVLLNGCGEDPKYIIRFYIEENEKMAAGAFVQYVKMPMSESEIAVNSTPVIFEGDIQNVYLAENRMLGRGILFEFKPRAARRLYELSISKRGKLIVATSNHEPFAVSRLEMPVQNGRLFMYAEMEPSMLEQYVKDIQQSIQAVQDQLDIR